MDGKLYFELFRIQQELAVPPDRKLTYDEKDALKKLLYTLFFGRPQDIERISEFVDQFEKAFPTVWKVIKHYKQHSHKKLAHKLQAVESGIFIDHVLRPLVVKAQEPFILSIHNSIVCGKPQIPIVKRQIQEAFSKAKFKIDHATLKIEGLGEDHQKDEVFPLLITSVQASDYFEILCIISKVFYDPSELVDVFPSEIIPIGSVRG